MADKKSSGGNDSNEEERLRRLFNSCDADGDGYLDGEDFTFMCRMLNLEDSANEIRFQLGMTDQSRISFDDFLRYRELIMVDPSLHGQHIGCPTSPAYGPTIVVASGGEDTGVESDASGMIGNTAMQQLTSWPTLSSDSLGAMSYSKPESADYDSGARDLSPEPPAMTLLQLMEVHDPKAFQQLRNAGLESCLDIADRIHMTTIGSMKGEILELKHHIHGLSVGRDREGHGVRESQEEEEEEEEEDEDEESEDEEEEHRLEQLTTRYEERIIELHSVIAELRKKVERHQINVIREEDEFEESDMTPSIQSNDGESRDENNEISLEFSRVVSQIETDLAGKEQHGGEVDENDEVDDASIKLRAVKVSTDEETALRLKNSFEVRGNKSTSIPEEDDELNLQQQDHHQRHQSQQMQSQNITEDRPPDLPPRTSRQRSMTPDIGMRSEVEVRELRTDNDELRRQTSQLEVELGEMTEKMNTVEDERDVLKKKVMELQQRLHNQALPKSPSQSRVTTPTKQNQPTSARSDRRSAEPAYPVAKVAELKKLKTCISDMQGLGSEVTALGIQSTSTAEHLVQSFHEGSGIAEMMQMKSPTTTMGEGTKREGSGSIGSGIITGVGHLSMAKEFQVELELRQAKIDHLKAQNDVITATLEESKSEAERLSVLMGRLESNHTALQLSYSLSDSCMEAQDALTTLMESEMGVLMASCRAAGIGGLANVDVNVNSEEVASILKHAHLARRKSESAARHLLSRLERSCGGVVGGGGGVGGHMNGNQPWEDLGRTHSSGGGCSGNKPGDHSEFSKVEETRLRDYIQQLKTDRLSVRRTVMELESVHKDPVMTEPKQQVEAQQLDLENAVLVQELMAVKEEKAELKAKSYLLEKEKRALELRLSGKETQEQAFRVQIDYLKGEVEYQQQLQQQQQQEYAIASQNQPYYSQPHNHYHRHPYRHHSSLSSSSSSSSSSTSSLNNINSSGNNNNNNSNSSFSNHDNNNGSNTNTGYPDTNLIAELQYHQRDPTELIRNLTLSREREHTLKERVSELMATLEKISRNSESRHKQSAEFVNDLKRANTALISAFDKAKKKYQGRLKKMEHQLKGLRDKYDNETSSLRHRIGLLEGMGASATRPPPDETSL